MSKLQGIHSKSSPLFQSQKINYKVTRHTQQILSTVSVTKVKYSYKITSNHIMLNCQFYPRSLLLLDYSWPLGPPELCDQVILLTGWECSYSGWEYSKFPVKNWANHYQDHARLVYPATDRETCPHCLQTPCDEKDCRGVSRKSCVDEEC